jgi:hypothetical protein
MQEEHLSIIKINSSSREARALKGKAIVHPKIAKSFYSRVGIAHQIPPIWAVNGGQCPPDIGNFIMNKRKFSCKIQVLS